MCNIYRFVKDLWNSLLIAKLGAYGFDAKALYYIKGYLDSRKQRVRVNSNLVLGKKLLLGYRNVPFKGHFYLNLCEWPFLFVSSFKLSNYAHAVDNTL